MKKTGFILGPALFCIMLLLPEPTGLSAEAWRVLALAAWILVWWISEAMPIALTALLPMVGLPLLGITDMKTSASHYASPIVYLFMGGFMLALALEKWGLHKRIALTIVKFTGTNANGIILGFLLATAFLSMWISNTATTIMMLPIALSVMDLLGAQGVVQDEKRLRAFSTSLLLCIAYGASIGGMATIIGTPPNVVFAGFIRETYGYEISFLNWMKVGIPFSLLMLAACYGLLVYIILPNGIGSFEGARELIDRQLNILGSASKAEKLTFVIFVCTAMAWIFRSLLNEWLPFRLGDEEIAILATIALFATPVDWRKQVFVLEWKDTDKLPWGILLLFGGGLSLAAALKEVGIIDLIGSAFTGAELSTFLLVLGITTVSLFLTEVMSNVALVTVFLPVVAGIASALNIHPLMICLPVTLAASCAFMLPMGTPPNAIVFAGGHLKMSDMVKAGFWLNIIAILLAAGMVKWLVPLIIPAG